MAIYVGDKRYAPYIGDKRRRYMGGAKGLPYDAEVEYLESTGTEFINSMVMPSSTLTTEVEFSVVEGFSFGTSSFMFGSYYSHAPMTTYSVALSSATKIRIPDGTGFSNSSSVPNMGTSKHLLSYRFGDATLDGVNCSTLSGSIGETTPPIRLFGRLRDSGTGSTITGKLRIYSFKLIDNSVTLLDLIPVRKGTVGYMYDKVSKQLFGNGGTGSFTLGPDKT